MPYAHINSTATQVVHSEPGDLLAVVVNSPGTTWAVTLWDNASAASGQAIAVIAAVAGGNYVYNTELVNGLTVSSTGTAGDITIVYG